MAAPAIATPTIPHRQSWMAALLEDLRPAPGRLSSTLRVVLASVIALVLMEALQMPFISIGMYFIFLVGRDSPGVSLRTGAFSLGIVILAVAVELSVVILSDNDPMARVLSVAVVTFVAGMIVVCTSVPVLGSAFGLIYCTVIALWELHAPADQLVKTSLYLIGTFMISLGSAVGVEYLFGDRKPAERLQEQRLQRYAALEEMFRLYAENAPQEKRYQAAMKVSRLAIAGQAGMMALYNAIVEQNLDTGSLPMAARTRITMLAQFMDVAAAFGIQNPAVVDPDMQARCAHIAEACKRLVDVARQAGLGVLPPTERGKHQTRLLNFTLLDRVDAALHAILSMPTGTGSKHELVALPSSKVPFFIPGAIKNRENVAFGLKISLCATFCYILYHALAWPGISTSVTTVLVTGLSTTGAIKQRLIFRALGSIIGGLTLALAAAVFLFPHMDTIASLIVVEAVAAFIAGWIAAGPKFNYIGLQIAFCFYILSFEKLSAPTELAPERDRFAGIMIALVVMIFVFDQIWPVRTTTAMRRGLASVIRIGAELFTTINQSTVSVEQREEMVRHADILRDRIGKTVAGLRTANSAVPYEFGANREAQILAGDMIVRCGITAAALFWNQLAILHNAADTDYLIDPSLKQLRSKIAAHLNTMAEAVEKQTPIPVMDAQSLVDKATLAKPRYAEFAHNTTARFQELQEYVVALGQPVP